MTEEARIRFMKREDIPRVVAIHLAAFRGFFLSSLGISFLRLYYQCVWADNTGIALVSEQTAQITGFAVGMMEPADFYRRTLRKRACRFAVALLVPTLRRPRTIMRALYRIRTAEGTIYEPGEALLASIAVDPALQSRGTGSALVGRFLVEAKLRGAHAAILTTQTENNDSTNRFYQQNGFTCRRTLVMPEGRQMNEYWQPI